MLLLGDDEVVGAAADDPQPMQNLVGPVAGGAEREPDPVPPGDGSGHVHEPGEARLVVREVDEREAAVAARTG